MVALFDNGVTVPISAALYAAVLQPLEPALRQHRVGVQQHDVAVAVPAACPHWRRRESRGCAAAAPARSRPSRACASSAAASAGSGEASSTTTIARRVPVRRPHPPQAGKRQRAAAMHRDDDVDRADASRSFTATAGGGMPRPAGRPPAPLRAPRQGRSGAPYSGRPSAPSTSMAPGSAASVGRGHVQAARAGQRRVGLQLGPGLRSAPARSPVPGEAVPRERDERIAVGVARHPGPALQPALGAPHHALGAPDGGESCGLPISAAPAEPHVQPVPLLPAGRQPATCAPARAGGRRASSGRPSRSIARSAASSRRRRAGSGAATRSACHRR